MLFHTACPQPGMPSLLPTDPSTKKFPTTSSTWQPVLIPQAQRIIFSLAQPGTLAQTLPSLFMSSNLI